MLFSCQIFYGSIIELKELIRNSNLTEYVPLQVYFIDLLALIPQQFLPFEKLQPYIWYLGATNNPDYFNYGVIAQSLLGFGIIELVARGALMGLLFGAIHNRVLKEDWSFWAAFFYIWLAIVCYQSFRNTMLHFVPLSIYQWVPVYIACRFIAPVFPNFRNRS